MRPRALGVLAVCVCLVSGCGYTTKSFLSNDIKAIYVENFVNKIAISAEQTDTRMYQGYRPGIETDITRAVIDRFIFDGNLKTAQPDNSQLCLKGSLIDFKKEPLRYDRNDSIEEFRITLTVELELIEAATGKELWREKSFSGEATYRTSGGLATSEKTAVDGATADLARRIVERTIEGW